MLRHKYGNNKAQTELSSPQKLENTVGYCFCHLILIPRTSQPGNILPTGHVLGLGIVGATTALLQKQRFIQEDFISIALIVFGMSVLAETIFACQLMLAGDRNPTDIWSYYQKVALASAIVSSLWAPVVYFPLNLWWQKLQLARQKP